MRIRQGLRLIGMLVSAVALSHCSRPYSLGNDEARTLIETLWNQPDVGLVLGNVKFVAEDPDTSKGRESIQEWPLYKASAKSGVITIANEKDLTNSYSANDWFNLTQSGIRKTATIGLTERGRAGGIAKKKGNFDELFVKVANTKIESIVGNDEEVVGTDRYRVVLGTHTYDVPEEMSGVFEASRGWDHVRERRFKVLLKYDPFDKQWKVVAADISKRTEDFRSNNVGRALQALKLGSR
jgi:hypothetical protein